MGKKPKKAVDAARMGRPVELPGVLGELARAVGGTSRLAERLAVQPRTVQRWASGSPIAASTRRLLEQLAGEHGLSLDKHYAPEPDSELPGVLGELARAVGGISRLAERLAVQPRTVQRWSTGSPVPAPTRVLLRQLAAEHGLSAAKQKALTQLNT